MARIVYFVPRLSLPLVGELQRAGHTVFEALTLADAFELIETENIDIALISPETSARGNPIHSKIMALTLSHRTTSADIIVELSQLFPGEDTRVQ